MKEEMKQMIREKVATNAGLPALAPRPIAGPVPGAVRVVPVPTTLVPITPVLPPLPAVIPDDLVIEITGDSGCYAFTLRPFEVSRLRGRFGRGPGFEQWVADRVRDLLVSFGGG